MAILRHPPFFSPRLDERSSPCMSEKMRHSPSQLTDSEIFRSQSIAAQNAAGLGGVVSKINQSFAELQVIVTSCLGNSLVATSNGLVPGFWDHLLQITFCHLFHHLFHLFSIPKRRTARDHKPCTTFFSLMSAGWRAPLRFVSQNIGAAFRTGRTAFARNRKSDSCPPGDR